MGRKTKKKKMGCEKKNGLPKKKKWVARKKKGWKKRVGGQIKKCFLLPKKFKI